MSSIILSYIITIKECSVDLGHVAASCPNKTIHLFPNHQSQDNSKGINTVKEYHRLYIYISLGEPTSANVDPFKDGLLKALYRIATAENKVKECSCFV